MAFLGRCVVVLDVGGRRNAGHEAEAGGPVQPGPGRGEFVDRRLQPGPDLVAQILAVEAAEQVGDLFGPVLAGVDGGLQQDFRHHVVGHGICSPTPAALRNVTREKRGLPAREQVGQPARR
jgi:hypothetical protein